MYALPEILKDVLSKEDVFPHSNILLEIMKNTAELRARSKKTKNIVLITGPTGAGTDTIIENLPEEKYVRSRAWTTRAEIRNDGIDKDKYVRVSREKFFSEAEKGNFIEYDPDFMGNAYGTHKSEAEKAFKDGRTPVLQINLTGAENIKKLFVDEEYPFSDANLFYVFVTAPTAEEFKYRLLKREVDKDYALKRYEKAISLIPYAKKAHFVLINERDKVPEAVTALTSLLQSFHS